MNFFKNLFSKKETYNVCVISRDSSQKIAQNVSFEEGQKIVRSWYDTQKKIESVINTHNNLGMIRHSENENTTIDGINIVLSRYLNSIECMLSITYDSNKFCEMEKRNE